MSTFWLWFFLCFSYFVIEWILECWSRQTDCVLCDLPPDLPVTRETLWQQGDEPTRVLEFHQEMSELRISFRSCRLRFSSHEGSEAFCISSNCAHDRLA